ncbi:MAG: hypothetical protein Q8P18_18395 [Pseudomonadota bacterium]|nr:hypothetical protein [Pseudomonadota bacterium]
MPSHETSPLRRGGHPLTNGVATPETRPDIDPAIVLLVHEMRRGQDSLRAEIVGAQRETTAAIGGLTREMRELRKQAPGRLAFYLAASIVVICLVAVFALIASRGVDVSAVSNAVQTVAPVVP